MNTIILAGNSFFYEEKILIGRCVEPKSKRILKRVSGKSGPQGILQKLIVLLSLVPAKLSTQCSCKVSESFNLSVRNFYELYCNEYILRMNTKRPNET